jgi:HK97 family phage major capsid protein/HK97 family phage prohead protease
VKQKRKLEDGQALKPLVRSLPFVARAEDPADSALDTETRTLRITFSSEEPVPRWFGDEVLSHAPGAADLSRAAAGACPLLFNHDMDDVIGIVEEAGVGADRRGYATVRFAKTARGDEVMGMVADGILRNVSFMYRVNKYLIESDPNDPDDDIYTATSWTVYEISMVSVPADASIGVGRSLANEETGVRIEFIDKTRAPTQPPAPAAISSGEIMKRKHVLQEAHQGDAGAGGGGAAALPDAATMSRIARAFKTGNFAGLSVADRAALDNLDADVRPPAPGAGPTAQDERARIVEIGAMCREHKLDDAFREKLITDGVDIGTARGLVLTQLGNRGTQAPLSNAHNPDLTDKEKRNWSLIRAVAAVVNGSWEKAGFEREVSREIAKNVGRDPAERSFFMPMDLPFAPSEQHARAWRMAGGGSRVMQQRAPYLVGTAGQGGNLVQTQLLADSFIEVLRNTMVTPILGARMLTGLVGNVDIPRQITATGTYWVGESSAPTEGEATFDKVSLRPKTIGALSSMSRLMLLQATPAIEMIAREDLIAVMGLGADLAALSGTGASNQPTGIVNQSGVGSVVGGTNGANLTFDHLISLYSAPRIANAPLANMAFAMNAKAYGYLATLKASTGQYLWDPQGGLTQASPDKVKGYGYAVSQQLRSTLTKGSSSGICSELLFGNWLELLIAMWGITEIAVNPFDSTGFKQGDVWVRAFQTMDIGVRHGASFAIMSDALTPGF